MVCSIRINPLDLLFTFLLCVLDNVESGTILDRSTGVHELGLGVDVASGLLAQAIKADLVKGRLLGI